MAAGEKSADAAKKTQCEREAAMQLYVARQKKHAYFERCLAGKELPPEQGVASRGVVRPSGRAAIPRPAPLGGANPPSTATGSTAPSTAPMAPSAPVVGSSGTSTTGSSATSISGSSGSSLGSSGSTTGSGR